MNFALVSLLITYLTCQKIHSTTILCKLWIPHKSYCGELFVSFLNSRLEVGANLIIIIIIIIISLKSWRSSHPELFCEKGVHRKTPVSKSLLIKLQGWVSFSLKETPTQVFSVNSAKLLRTSFCTEHFQWLLLKLLGLY